MADARKRARGKTPAPAELPAETPAAEPVVPPQAQSTSTPESSEPIVEEFVFPADSSPEEAPVSVSSRPLSLPSSGLASDILASEAAQRVQPLQSSEPQAVTDASSAAGDGSGQNFSFFSAPAREDKESKAEAMEHLATFYLDEEEYGLPVKLVQEIIRVSEITQVPRAPEFIKGVINLRGRIIPVIDLRRKLGLGDVKTTRETRIVVVGLSGRLIGLLVDGASQVLRVPVASVEPAPEEIVEIDTNFIRGVAKLEKRLIILIDLSRVLARELREAGVDDPVVTGEPQR
jgi:purine-binding chemotaxis protein CheW